MNLGVRPQEGPHEAHVDDHWRWRCAWIGWMARRCDPAVRERFHKLLFALGKEFDGRIEGINFAETAGSFGFTGRLFPKGFSFEIYRDGIITNMQDLKRAFPKSVVLFSPENR
jgi:hypothetical protein